MKTSLDLPDDLYRKVKSKSALEGRAVREVATALFAAWVEGRVTAEEVGMEPAAAPANAQQLWLDRWRELATRVSESDARGGGLVEQLQADRR